MESLINKVFPIFWELCYTLYGCGSYPRKEADRRGLPHTEKLTPCSYGMGGNTNPTHFSFFAFHCFGYLRFHPTYLPFLPLRFHLKTVRLIADFIISEAIVDIRIRTYSIRGHLTTRRATRPQIRYSRPSCDCLGCLLVKIAAGILALPPGY